MSCKMPVKEALHPRLSGAQQPDDERLYSYRVTTNRFFSSYSPLKLPFEDKGQNILNAAITHDPNYHVKMFKISWTRHDRLNKDNLHAQNLLSWQLSFGISRGAAYCICCIFSYSFHSEKAEAICSSRKKEREGPQVQGETQQRGGVERAQECTLEKK